MTPCPVCQTPVDSLRARFVAVRDGKIVAFCSAEHLAQGGGSLSSPAAVAAATAAAGVTTSVSRTATPPAGVPARATPPAGAPAVLTGKGGDPHGPPRPVTPAPGVPVSLESGPVITIESGATPRGDASEPRAKHPDEISMAAFWNADKARKDRTGPVTAIPADDEDAAGDKAKQDGGALASASKATKHGGAVASAAKTAKRDVVAASDAQPATIAAVASDGVDAKRSRTGPAAAIASKTAADSVDELPAVSRDTEAPPRSRLPLVLAVLVVLGIGGFALYRFVFAPSGAIEQLPRPQALSEPRPPVPPPPPPSTTGLLVHAKATLEQFAKGTPRIARVAAAALSRTGEPGRDVLASQLGLPGAARSVVETSEIGRLDLAYALGRSGDPRGTQLLVAALASSRGDVRDEAARLLAQLHDARAIPHLLDLLSIPQRRMAAAESLVRLGEPRAITALTALRADPKTSADDKARATIALGLAGKRDVAPALRAMLADPHFNAFAAAALAELGDQAAADVLAQQLSSPALGVYAARALRRLDPRVADPGNDVIDAVLVPKLTIDPRARDIDQVTTAEAALLVLGDAAWSKYE